MSAFDPVARLAAYHAAINRLDFEALEQGFAENAVYLSGGTGNVAGRDAIMAAFRSYFDVFPDQVAGDDRIERLGDRKARAVWHLTATHTLTGAAVHRRGIETVTFDERGLITEVLVEDL